MRDKLSTNRSGSKKDALQVEMTHYSQGILEITAQQERGRRLSYTKILRQSRHLIPTYLSYDVHLKNRITVQRPRTEHLKKFSFRSNCRQIYLLSLFQNCPLCLSKNIFPHLRLQK